MRYIRQGAPARFLRDRAVAVYRDRADREIFQAARQLPRWFWRTGQNVARAPILSAFARRRSGNTASTRAIQRAMFVADGYFRHGVHHDVTKRRKPEHDASDQI